MGTQAPGISPPWQACPCPRPCPCGAHRGWNMTSSTLLLVNQAKMDSFVGRRSCRQAGPPMASSMAASLQPTRRLFEQPGP